MKLKYITNLPAFLHCFCLDSASFSIDIHSCSMLFVNVTVMQLKQDKYFTELDITPSAYVHLLHTEQTGQFIMMKNLFPAL